MRRSIFALVVLCNALGGCAGSARLNVTRPTVAPLLAYEELAPEITVTRSAVDGPTAELAASHYDAWLAE